MAQLILNGGYSGATEGDTWQELFARNAAWWRAQEAPAEPVVSLSRPCVRANCRACPGTRADGRPCGHDYHGAAA